MFKVLHSTALLSHHYLESCLATGAVAIDATVGNGHDTLYLAQKVAPGGVVYGFDIQEQAIQAATELISRHGFADMVRLVKAGHENMGKYVKEPVDAIIFNLGYLPGGDRSITTFPQTTVEAVHAGLTLLKPGGVMCIVVYTGHPGGDNEQQVLETYLQCLEKEDFCVGKLNFLNRDKAPYLLIVEKSHGKPGGMNIENRKTQEDN